MQIQMGNLKSLLNKSKKKSANNFNMNLYIMPLPVLVGHCREQSANVTWQSSLNFSTC